MKKLFLLLILMSTISSAQSFYIGFGQQSYILGNPNFSLSPLGLKIHGRYKISNDFSLLTNTSLSLMPAKKGAVTYQTDNFIQIQFEESVLYFFRKYNFKPYVGVGIGYYINKVQTSTHPVTFNIETNEEAIGETVDAGLGFLLNTGLSKFYGLTVELKFIVHNPTLNIDVIKDGDIRKMRKVQHTINFNSLFLSLVYEFSLL